MQKHSWLVPPCLGCSRCQLLSEGPGGESCLQAAQGGVEPAVQGAGISEFRWDLGTGRPLPQEKKGLALNKDQISFRSCSLRRKVALPNQNPKLCLPGAVQMLIPATLGPRQDQTPAAQSLPFSFLFVSLDACAGAQAPHLAPFLLSHCHRRTSQS